jgi:hypothetical protein
VVGGCVVKKSATCCKLVLAFVRGWADARYGYLYWSLSVSVSERERTSGGGCMCVMKKLNFRTRVKYF